jgi:hypothetical protein
VTGLNGTQRVRGARPHVTQACTGPLVGHGPALSRKRPLPATQRLTETLAARAVVDSQSPLSTELYKWRFSVGAGNLELGGGGVCGYDARRAVIVAYNAVTLSPPLGLGLFLFSQPGRRGNERRGAVGRGVSVRYIPCSTSNACPLQMDARLRHRPHP